MKATCWMCRGDHWATGCPQLKIKDAQPKIKLPVEMIPDVKVVQPALPIECPVCLKRKSNRRAYMQAYRKFKDKAEADISSKSQKQAGFAVPTLSHL